MAKIKYQTPTGMHDILSSQQKYFDKILSETSKIANFYNFSKIETPILEDAEIFLRGVGASTDVVQKEMYLLKTKGGDVLALRPEATAPVARAYIEHGMASKPQPVKLFYFGPFFRYERPQAGRYRQFWQLGFESLGEENPIIDAQLIQICHSLLSSLGLKNISIEINSIGDKACLPPYKRTLIRYLKSKQANLCPDCRRRAKENPLRFLDCKDERCCAIKHEAPQIINYLCPECHEHFAKILEYLDEMDIPYEINPYIVRGLDYYNRTVFEVFNSSEEEQSKIALGGGGRYDNLVKLLGGKDTPGVGFAFGIERLAFAMEKAGTRLPAKREPFVFIAQLGDLAKKKSLILIEKMRKARITVGEALEKDSLKIQLNRAAKMKAKVALIIGQKEALEEMVILRDMTTGKQEMVKMERVLDVLKKKMKKK